MAAIERENWQQIIGQLNNDSGDLTEVCIKIEMLGGNQIPEVRQAVAAIIGDEERFSRLDEAAKQSLIFTLIGNPTREEVELISRYWDLQHPTLLSATTLIIFQGQAQLSPPERFDYAQRSRRYFAQRKTVHDWPNACSGLVKLVAEFEGQSTGPWLCQILSEESPCYPIYTLAYHYAVVFKEQDLITTALLTHLKRLLKSSQTEYPDLLFQCGLIVNHLLGDLADFLDEEAKGYIAQARKMISSANSSNPFAKMAKDIISKSN